MNQGCGNPGGFGAWLFPDEETTSHFHPLSASARSFPDMIDGLFQCFQIGITRPRISKKLGKHGPGWYCSSSNYSPGAHRTQGPSHHTRLHRGQQPLGGVAFILFGALSLVPLVLAPHLEADADEHYQHAAAKWHTDGKETKEGTGGISWENTQT